MPKHIYKIGDNVRVRPDLGNTKYISKDGYYKDTATRYMIKLANKIVTIKELLSNGKYFIEEENSYWVDSMFEPIREVPEGHVELPNGTYRPFEIPRKNKAPRKICAPGPELLAYQREQLKNLEEVLKHEEEINNIENIYHGFIQNRNCVTAAKKHVGYDMTIMMDIVAFFDSVTMEHTKITDPSLYTAEGYCGQGFATSPMLANIGIIPIVKAVDDYLKAVYGKYAFTIYADDIQISINSEDYNEANNIIEIVTAAFEVYGFDIHPHKTRIRYAKHGYRRILGINVGNEDIRATRKTMKRLRAAKHQKNGPSAGGLSTWSKCLLPKKLRYTELPIPTITDKAAYIEFWTNLYKQGKKLDFKVYGKQEPWEYYGEKDFSELYTIESWVTRPEPFEFRIRPNEKNKSEYTNATTNTFPDDFN